MKLFGKILQRIKSDRAGQLDAIIDVIDTTQLDGTHRTPSWTTCKILNRHLSVSNQQERIGIPGNHRLQADMGPSLRDIVRNRPAAGNLDQLCDVIISSNGDHWIV